MSNRAQVQCPACHADLPEGHPYGWCPTCGSKLPDDVLRALGHPAVTPPGIPGPSLHVEDGPASTEEAATVDILVVEDEAALVGEIDAETLVVKRGARGCLVRSGGRTSEYDAVPAAVVDSTGAGDAFAAGFLLGGPELGLEAAARCIGQMGGMP